MVYFRLSVDFYALLAFSTRLFICQQLKCVISLNQIDDEDTITMQDDINKMVA